MKAIRHGDVVLRPIEKLPVGKTIKHAELTLAYGEVTGHHHTLYPEKCGLEQLGAYVETVEVGGKRFIKLDCDWLLSHQEHKEIKVPAGAYEIGMEREYDPFQKIMRKVVD